jgi:hypothetical protein
MEYGLVEIAERRNTWNTGLNFVEPYRRLHWAYIALHHQVTLKFVFFTLTLSKRYHYLSENRIIV